MIEGRKFEQVKRVPPPRPSKERTGAEVKVARARVGLPRHYLAQMVGVRDATLRRWENGGVPLRQVDHAYRRFLLAFVNLVVCCGAMATEGEPDYLSMLEGELDNAAIFDVDGLAGLHVLLAWYRGVRGPGKEILAGWSRDD